VLMPVGLSFPMHVFFYACACSIVYKCKNLND